MLSKFFTVLAYLVLPSAAFFGGAGLTETYFRYKLIPYPSETYGIVVGAGLFFWTLALMTFWMGKIKKRRKTHE